MFVDGKLRRKEEEEDFECCVRGVACERKGQVVADWFRWERKSVD